MNACELVWTTLARNRSVPPLTRRAWACRWLALDLRRLHRSPAGSQGVPTLHTPPTLWTTCAKTPGRYAHPVDKGGGIRCNRPPERHVRVWRTSSAVGITSGDGPRPGPVAGHGADAPGEGPGSAADLARTFPTGLIWPLPRSLAACPRPVTSQGCGRTYGGGASTPGWSARRAHARACG